MSKITDNFIVDVDQDNGELITRMAVEATFNHDCTNLSIDKITDADNGFREINESELTFKEAQQLMAGVIKQVITRYNLYGGSL